MYVNIDLTSIAPELAQKLEDIRTEADKLEHLARELYMFLGYDVTAKCEADGEPDNDK